MLEFEAMKPEPSIFDTTDPEADAAADARAEADIEAGRVISHEAMTRWLQSWGTANELPRPKCGE
jgi:predicted transcriptional regulator